MKKFLLSIFAISMFIPLSFGACAIIATRPIVEECLPGLTSYKFESGPTLERKVEYEKYTYKDTEKLREKLKNHRDFIPVTADKVEYITSFFDNFDGWAEAEGFYPEYDFDKSCIGEGDYYDIENLETADESSEGFYRRYDVYYFDIESMTSHYLHIFI